MISSKNKYNSFWGAKFPLSAISFYRSKKQEKKQEPRSFTLIVLLLASKRSCFYKKDAATIGSAYSIQKYLSKRIVNLFFYLLLFFTTIHFAHADVSRDDTTKVDVRTFDADKLEKYKHDARYNYKNSESVIMAALNRFLEWLGRIFNRNLKNASASPGVGNVINIILALAAIALLIFGLSKVKFRSWITGKGAVIEQEYEVEEENIHKIEFDKDIRDAEKDGDYRRAIRLQFLKVLKNLSDAELIYWDPNKTNYQYSFELNGSSNYTSFVKCVHIFDLVWYGELLIDQSYYNAQKIRFEELIKSSGKIKTAVYNG